MHIFFQRNHHIIYNIGIK